MLSSLSRRFGVLSVLAVAAVSPIVWAQSFPSKPVRIVVPFVAGGATDSLARLLAEKLAPRLGQPVVVDNKPGANGTLGTDVVAKAAPDGHTLVLALTGSLLTNQFLYEKLPYQPQRDFALLSQIVVAPLIWVVHPSIPANTPTEMLKYIAQNKAKLTYGSYGQGSYPHLAGSYMSDSLGADMSHAAYKGEAAMVQDLLGGQIPMAFASATVAKAHIEAGKLKALGVTGTQRLTALPNLPTLAEQGMKDDIYRSTGWIALAAPANTPKAAMQRLSDEVVALCDAADVKQRVLAMGLEIKCNTPEAFSALYKQEYPMWEKYVKQSGVKLD